MIQPILYLIFILICLPSCKVGHKYRTPTVPLPEKFSEQRIKSAQADLASWWTFFNDPYLNELVVTALNNNFDLRIATEKIKEMRDLYGVQFAKLFPEIDATGTILGNKVSKKLIQNASLTTQHLDYFGLGFDSLWEIDFWGKQQSAADASFNEYQAQVEGMRDIYIILLGDVTKTYIDIRTTQKKIDLLTKQIKIDTKLLNLTTDRLKSGVDSEIPDTNQRAALDQSKSELINLQILLKQAINRLAVLLGENPEKFILKSSKHEVPKSTKTLSAGLPSELLQRRPDIRRAERLLSAATERISEAKADWFPSFSLLGGIHAEASHGSKVFSNGSLSWTIGPSVRLPILTFGRIKYNVEAKKSSQRQALLAYAQSVVSALGDVENCLISYFDGSDRCRILNQKLQAITKERDLTKSLFNSGLDNELQYLITEKNRLLVEQSLVDAQKSVSTSLVSVYKSLGGGW